VVSLYVLHAWQSEIGKSTKPFVSTSQELRIAACKNETITILKPGALDIQTLADVYGVCSARVNSEDVLSEAGIRRNAFLIQQSETTTLMWMVVIITVSGVVLAGMQLITSFKLSLLGKAPPDAGSSTFSADAHQLSVSSSVSGIMVLAISLCFFYIFTREIYAIRGVEADKQTSAPTLTGFDMRPGPAAATGAASGAKGPATASGAGGAKGPAAAPVVQPIDPEVEKLAEKQARSH
jgi:hypothetical protein